MTPDGLAEAQERMRAHGVPEPGLRSFTRLYGLLESGDPGHVAGEDLEPARDIPVLGTEPYGRDRPSPALDATAVVKLNGGLATTMGLSGPKSLVEVRPGTTFLDLIRAGLAALRRRHGARLPLVLMNSEATREASLRALGDDESAGGVPADFLQHVEPRLCAEDHRPIAWPEDPRQEWCPPGHGDLFPALVSSGMLAALREAGYRRLFVSNADNLGAFPDAAVAEWVAASGAPLVLEVVEGTAADRKGGHLALRDGRLLLRETAQAPPGDDSFTDHARWRWYATNNLWLDLDQLGPLLQAAGGVLDLPLIVNRKTLGGRLDVLQLETAMGSALGVVEGAVALGVPRRRFAPVKTTDDLLVVRSDAYVLDDDDRLVLAPGRERAPYVALDPACFGHLHDMESRFPHGPPSLVDADRLVVHGDVTFGADVRVVGDVSVDGPARIADGTTLEGARAA